MERPQTVKLLKDCADRIRGPTGSKVKLEIVYLAGHKTNTVEVARGTIEGAPKPHTTDRSALVVVVLELFGLAVMFWIARIRNWPLGEWGFQPSWKLTGAGLVLFSSRP